MNREIKFRGKDALTGKWVFGDLMQKERKFTRVTSCARDLQDTHFKLCMTLQSSVSRLMITDTASSTALKTLK